eukprot:scaffold2362_cov109-Cylindrotheca_fusiformis.AAC.8
MISWKVMRLLLLAGISLTSWLSDAQQEPEEEEPCENGSCPTPSNMEARDEEKCGMWMGPSPIKEHEQHGFGLGIFTGKHIAAGDVVDAGILVPVLDWDGYARHPPLREQVWNGENIPTMSISSHWGTFYFLPGLGCIVPCTSENPSLTNVNEFYEEMYPHDHPATGSFSRYKQSFFQATRDIMPGEELTVFCTDDDFDGGTYALSKYHQSTETEEIFCLDDTVHVQPVSTNPSASGMGVYAKRNIQRGEVIISTPVVPLSRYETKVPQEIIEEYDVPNEQLLLNYCYGHPNSDLLFLPLGPTVNYINHHDSKANVQVRWHDPSSTNGGRRTYLTRRQEYHHPELLTLPPNVVADIHGKGLMFDYVAMTDIQEGDEIFLDYGESWTKAWKEHESQWKQNQRDYHYQSSLEYSEEHGFLKTLRTPKEQMNHPYPPNIMFTCLYSDTWNDPPKGETYVHHNYYAKDENDNCIMPCTIEDRYEKEVPNEDTGELETLELYRTKLIEVSNHTDVDFECLLVPDVIYDYVDVPRDAIFVVDRPYTADEFQPKAFRHEIQVPDGMFPDIWLEKKVRRRDVVKVEDHTDHSFKRRQPKTMPQQKRVFY